jgi:hypothetical protein
MDGDPLRLSGCAPAHESTLHHAATLPGQTIKGDQQSTAIFMPSNIVGYRFRFVKAIIRGNLVPLIFEVLQTGWQSFSECRRCTPKTELYKKPTCIYVIVGVTEW